MTVRRPAPAEGDEITLADMMRRCESVSLPLTGPRRAILEVMVALDGTHPTADEVHVGARERSLEIGRATVYRTLETFVELGILTKASHTGTAVRYDAITARHHHLVCLRCNGIVDIADQRLDALPVPDTSKLGFEVRDVQVQLRGLCRSCQDFEKEDQS